MFKRINITLPAEVLEQADAYAALERYSRSGLIAAALKAYIAGPAGPEYAPRGGVSFAAEAVSRFGSTAVTAPPTRGPSLSVVGPLLRAYLLGRDDIEAAWVFGSVAHGHAGPLSDVDVAVLAKGSPDGAARWGLRTELSSRLPEVLGVREVDVAVLPDLSVAVGYRALVRGERVFGDESPAAAEAEVRAAGEYWDTQPLREMLAARLGERLRADAQRG